MIKLQVIGNLGKDCIVNQISGKNVMNFNVAHTEKFKDSTGNMKEKTTWVECAYWSDRTALAPYLQKGTQVFVEGTPDVHMYTDNQGQQKSSLRLRVAAVQLLGTKSQDGAQNTNQGYQQNNSASQSGMNTGQGAIPEPPDDLPF